MLKIVLLFFCVIIIFIILILLARIKLEIRQCDIFKSNKKEERQNLRNNFAIYIGIYLFGKIKILNIKISNKLLNKAKNTMILNMNKKIDKEIIKKTIWTIKKVNINIEQFDLNLEIGSESVVFTSYAVAGISAILGVILCKSDYRNIYFNITPNYTNKNVLDMNLKCMISVKVWKIFFRQASYYFLGKA